MWKPPHQFLSDFLLQENINDGITGETHTICHPDPCLKGLGLKLLEVYNVDQIDNIGQHHKQYECDNQQGRDVQSHILTDV